MSSTQQASNLFGGLSGRHRLPSAAIAPDTPLVVAIHGGTYTSAYFDVPGASLMVRREVIDRLGGMDEGYFLYYEETDFCRKVKRAGYDVWYVPDSRVMHLVGQSTGRSAQTSSLSPVGAILKPLTS